MTQFSANLKYLRKKFGYNQIELAKKLGLSKGQIWNYENGISYPLMEIAFKICEEFDVGLDDLFRNSINEPPPEPPTRNGKHTEWVGESNPLKAVKAEAEQPPPLPQNKGDNNKEEIKLLRQTALEILNKIELMNA
jgi:transcriptional regulator with XRE-family HTH domain